MKEESLLLAPYQTRPLIFRLILVQPSCFNFSVEIAYRTEHEDQKIITTPPFNVDLVQRSIFDAQKFTFLHPAGVVSYAIIRPPPTSAQCVLSAEPLPILLSLHGAGLEADSRQVREMFDAAYGICAWMLFPTGVTPWSGDDWRKILLWLLEVGLLKPWIDTWGIADVEAAIGAIPSWIKGVGWKGGGVNLDAWIVTGHSNGGNHSTSAPSIAGS
jgi:hypothetical protein